MSEMPERPREDEVDAATKDWGVDVASVELKDIELPENMVRTIGKQAEMESFLSAFREVMRG